MLTSRRVPKVPTLPCVCFSLEFSRVPIRREIFTGSHAIPTSGMAFRGHTNGLPTGTAPLQETYLPALVRDRTGTYTLTHFYLFGFHPVHLQ